MPADAVTALAKSILKKEKDAAWAEIHSGIAEQAKAIVRPPLYGHESLRAFPSAKVILCHGEDATDDVQMMSRDDYAVVGVRVAHTNLDSLDWDSLKGRTVIILHRMPNMYAPKIIGKASEIFTVEDIPAEWTPTEARQGGWEQPEFIAWLTPKIRTFILGQDQAPVRAIPIQKSEPIIVADPEQEDVPASVVRVWEQLGLAINKQGEPVSTVDNICRTLEAWPAWRGLVWYDEFHRAIRTRYRTGEEHSWDKTDGAIFEGELNGHFGMTKLTNPQLIQRGIIAYAHSHPFRNEPRDWMETLIWDGKPRIDGFLTNYVGSLDTRLMTSVSANLWISMVARVFKPGCKYDMMPYLKGKQGKLKSSLLQAIGGKWYAITSSSVHDKDFFQCLKGHMLMEVADLHSIMGTKVDANRVKMVLTSATDTYRASYAESVESHPRFSVFIGTTNEDKPLRDPTGNRRFLPIETGRINVEATLRDRNMLFAEAVTRFKAGAPWWIVNEDEAAKVQESDYEEDAWEEPILLWLENESAVTVARIAEGALNLGIGHVHLPEQRRITTILRRNRWIQTRIKEGKGQRRAWERMQVEPGADDQVGANPVT